MDIMIHTSNGPIHSVTEEQWKLTMGILYEYHLRHEDYEASRLIEVLDEVVAEMEARHAN